MKDWAKFSRLEGIAKTEGSTPSIWRYIAIKLTDNGLATIVVFLLLFFGSIGLFVTTTETQTNWALHAAELCLGVLLGLLKAGVASKPQE